MRDTLQNFWALRLFAASTVIFSHSFLIAEGTEEHEPFVRIFGSGNILGIYGVYAFFIISGFLITQSALSSRTTLSFAIKRIGRIYPALVVCAFLSAGIIGSALTSLELSQFWMRLIPFRTLFAPPYAPITVFKSRLSPSPMKMRRQ
jgi:peptidoglycan/LPS O-acetylase OafA/YrhL